MSLPECCKNCCNKPKEGEFKTCCCALPSLTIISNTKQGRDYIESNFDMKWVQF